MPDHEDRTPSFTVNPAKGLWLCHGCIRGGDVITLAQRVWDIDRADVAAAEILLFFGHEIPLRPASWYRKQVRQKPIRNGIEAAKLRIARRRLYKKFFEPLVLASTNEEDRAHDAQLFWELTAPLAEDLVGAMMGRQGR